MESQVIEIRADVSKAQREFDKLNDGMTSFERRALQTAQRAASAWDDFTARTVRAMKAAADATRQFFAENAELIRSLGLMAIAAYKHEGSLQKLANGYKIARLAISPYTTGIILAADALAVLTLRQAKLIEVQAQAAAQAKLTAREYQLLQNTATATGQDPGLIMSGIDAVRSNPGAFRAFGVETSYGAFGARSPQAILADAQARLGRISNPFERARQREELGIPADLRLDLQDRAQTANRYGYFTSEEGAQALDRLRRAADGLASTFGDLWRNAKLFGQDLFRGGAEGIATAVDRVAKLGEVGRQQSEARRRAQGRTGDLADKLESWFGGTVAVLTGPDQATMRDEYFSGLARSFRRGGAPTFVPGPTPEKLREDQRISDAQKAELNRREQEAMEAQARALRMLSDLRAKEGGDVAEIRERYRQYREELGKTAVALDALARAETKELQQQKTRVLSGMLKQDEDARSATRQERRSALQSRFGQLAGEAAEEFQFNFLDPQERQRKVDAFNIDLSQKFREQLAQQGLESEARQLTKSREMQIAVLGEVNATTLRQKLQLEQQKLAIEEEFLRKSEELSIRKINADRVRQIAALQNVNPDFASQSYKDALADINRGSDAQVAAVRTAAGEDRDLAKLRAVAQQSQIIRTEFQQTFQAIKSQTATLFATLVSDTRNFGSVLRATLMTALLAPLQDWVSTGAARLLTGNGGGSGSTGGGSGRGFGFSRLLGVAGASSSYGSVFTPGFNGGAGGGEYAGGGAGSGAAGAASGLSGYSSGLLSGLRSLGNIGRPALGPGSSGGSYGGKGYGGVAGGAMLVGGGILGFDGLRRGGLFGLGETTAGGALIGLKFGGLEGAAIGAAIGFGAGLVRFFIKGAEQKAIEKIKEVYGVTINRDLAKVIVQQAKQFGGLDIAVTVPQVRELVELYAMATGQRIGAGSSIRPVNLVQNSSGVFQMAQNINGQAYTFRSPFATYGGVSSQAMPGPTVIQLDRNATTDLLEGKAVQAMQSRPVASQQALTAPLEWTPRSYAG